VQAIILSAGLGTRLRGVSGDLPKPLMLVGGQPLIVHHLNRLAAANIRDIVINVSHKADMIRDALGDGNQHGVNIQYSFEDEPLEAAGGICLALHRKLLNPANVFLSVNADIFCDVDFAALPALPEKASCLLLLTNNPPEHPKGDFSIVPNGECGVGVAVGMLTKPEGQTYTYTGIGVYRPEMFANLPPGEKAALLPLLQAAIDNQRACAVKHSGVWHDAGTPESLARADDAAR